MKNILHDLYNGKIIPWERYNPGSDKQNEILSKIEERERYFTAKLSPDDSQRFQELTQLYRDLSNVEEDDLFSYAFTLGLLLTMDVMKETEMIYND